MTQKATRFVVGLFALGMASIKAPPAVALISNPVNLADLVRKSDQIVFGTVTAVDQGIDESGLPYTQIQIEVDESLRGAAVATLSFRQFGLQSSQSVTSTPVFFNLPAGMPRYAEGERVMLFLDQASSIGFRTTVGLEQGRFVLSLGTLQNGSNNAGLFHDVDLTKAKLDAKDTLLVTTRDGAVDADAFVDFVRRAVRENWWVAAERSTSPALRP